MIALWAALALAAPPEGLDLGDVGRWEDASERLLNGPVGCWDVVGKASWSYDVGRFGTSRGDAAFVGRLDKGVWRDIHVQPAGELVRERKGSEDLLYSEELRFVPLLGRLHPALWGDEPDDSGRRKKNAEEELEAPFNALVEFLDRVDSDVDYTYATWDEATASVRLQRTIPLGNGARAPEAELEVRFPEGGVVPASMSVSFPDRVGVGTWPRRATVRDAQVEAVMTVVDGEAFPSAETYTAQVDVLGFSFSFAQTVSYTWAKACAAP
jgi:hypothetical protein